ncbi:MAG: ABC transporter [Chloroflexi bacterium]|nr:ABC transporter [Chloroflexota bacterium]MCH2308306.1 ABC transporter ATP-binding protein [SAR202 cluster bacterium]MQG05335.1 ABC transporter ATP-binding protein [SAR202 cluster bacterium]GIT16204.1 MAG: ABC transporter ATP-binding protein [Chloroflexota bacterium]
MTDQNRDILCEDLFKIYRASGIDVVALRGLDLTINSGEMIGVVGASGSGKSTFLNMLAGFDKPSAGLIKVFGFNLNEMKQTEIQKYRRSQIGFVWQESMWNLFPYLSVIENVMLPMNLMDDTNLKKKKKAEQLLDLVGIRTDQFNNNSKQLSGGELQRIAIAIALANDPALLLADEPTGQLDSLSASNVFDCLKTVNKQKGTTVVIVTHDPGISVFVDRSILIRDGRACVEIIKDNEFVLVDHNNMLQIPEKYMKSKKLEGRVRMDLSDGDLLISSVEKILK